VQLLRLSGGDQRELLRPLQVDPRGPDGRLLHLQWRHARAAAAAQAPAAAPCVAAAAATAAARTAALAAHVAAVRAAAAASGAGMRLLAAAALANAAASTAAALAALVASPPSPAALPSAVAPPSAFSAHALRRQSPRRWHLVDSPKYGWQRLQRLVLAHVDPGAQGDARLDCDLIAT
jgi:hypothetical protein